ncbi:MAG: aromatic amino acid lyase, partial [Pseudomonadota bacterium]
MAPGHFSLGDARAILAGAAPRLDPACRLAVERAQGVIARAAAGDAPVYGVNTGFGKLASVRIPPADTARLQRNLILSHAAGVGPALPEPVVRLSMALKLVSLGRGASGVRWELISLLEEMLIRGVSPVIPAQGSVGASGDLAPLAHLAAVMIGEGEAFCQGERMAGADALSRAEISPIELGPKEGLALINGTQISTGLALSGLIRGMDLAETALVTGALAVDAAMGSTAPFRPEIHALRGLGGQISAAQTLRRLLDGSEIR